MNRRKLMESLFAAVVASGGVASRTAAVEPVTHDHTSMSGPYRALVTASSHCVDAAEACEAHCIALLGEGDRELEACLKTSRDTVAACTALRSLAAADSPHVGNFAKIVADVCNACAKECHKHAQHPVCRDCEQACIECARACAAVAA